MTAQIVISGYARTPMGGFQGALSVVRSVELGAAAVQAAVERPGVETAAIQRIYMGCVLQHGAGAGDDLGDSGRRAEARGGRRGVAGPCIGGGEATAVAIELI